jgi:hypothetical protein
LVYNGNCEFAGFCNFCYFSVEENLEFLKVEVVVFFLAPTELHPDDEFESVSISYSN